MISSADLKKTGGWDEAIARDAESVLDPLPAPEQQAVKLVFQRVTEKGTGEHPIRTPCSLAELIELTRPLVTPERLREILAAFRARGDAAGGVRVGGGPDASGADCGSVGGAV